MKTFFTFVIGLWIILPFSFAQASAGGIAGNGGTDPNCKPMPNWGPESYSQCTAKPKPKDNFPGADIFDSN